MAEVLRVNPSIALAGTFDPEQRFARFPTSHTIKGLFFPRLVDMLGDGWPAVAPTLKAAPRDGRYVSFSDYPQVDYSRIVWAVAKRAFPNLPAREAARRVAWKDIEVYASSRVGGVTLALLGDPRVTLCKLPQLMSLVLRGGTVVARELAANRVELTYRRFFGWVDCYVVGTLEGIVQRFDKRPEIAVTLQSESDATYDVSWS